MIGKVEITSSSLFNMMVDRALLFGDFTLSSGARSHYYFDCRRLTLWGPAIQHIGDTFTDLAMANLPNNLQITAIGGPETGAVAIVTAMTQQYTLKYGQKIEGFYVRKQQKEHGTEKLIEGAELGPGHEVVIVEDVGTSGKSIENAMRPVLKTGAKVPLVIVLLDRLAGARERITKEFPGTTFVSVFTSNMFQEIIDKHKDGS